MKQQRWCSRQWDVKIWHLRHFPIKIWTKNLEIFAHVLPLAKWKCQSRVRCYKTAIFATRCRCDQIWQNLATLAKFWKSWTIFEGLFTIWQKFYSTLANMWCYWARLHSCRWSIFLIIYSFGHTFIVWLKSSHIFSFKQIVFIKKYWPDKTSIFITFCITRVRVRWKKHNPSNKTSI